MGELPRKCWICPTGTAASLGRSRRSGTPHVDGGAEREAKGTMMNIVGRTGASKGIGKADPDLIRKIDVDFLDRMEAAGGHTLDRHVSKTNEELIKRAFQEDVEAATTFTNKHSH
jgi:hypothetical protein